MDINALYEIARSGDRAAEDDLFQTLAVRLGLIAHHRIWDKADAEDVVQNSLMIIAREYKKMHFDVSFSAWAHKVLDNRILAHIKQKRSRGGQPAPLFDELNRPDAWTADPTLESRLLECLQEVSAHDRRYARMLNLHYQGYTTQEVCERLKITPKHSYVILFRARSRLEKCLEEDGIL
jgi:RNA polymerase sigma-70 factor (ECF subfamily)